MANVYLKSRAAAIAAALTAILLSTAASGQQNVRPRGNQQGNLNAVGFGNPNGNGGNPGAPGGAASADFDSLIDLIQSTVQKDTWSENGTGEGDIMPFAINGVYADANRALAIRQGGDQLAAVRARGAKSKPAASGSAVSANAATEVTAESAASAQASPLRYVSLPKLEAAIAARQREHLPLDRDMLALAGLQRVSHVLVYPETGDLVLAGPAGDWMEGPGGALVSVDGGRPVVRLDDLLALWRRQRDEKSKPFGCSIVPQQEALARVQDFLAASAAQPLEPGQRRQWLKDLRDTLGLQDVEYFNVDPGTRLARVLLAADYHMKLVGMGLVPGVPGVKSYLATVRVTNGAVPPMTVLRWWFSMPEAAIEADAAHEAFALPGRCVEVLSENEMLAARGERVHTGESDELNSRFADSFTANYAALAEKYPIYGEMERLFEVAIALALIEREGLAEKAAWTPTLLLDAQRLRLPKAAPLTAVETVINHRVIGGRQIIAGISGGVWIDGVKKLAVFTTTDEAEAKLTSMKKSPHAKGDSPAEDNGEVVWWWD